MKARSAVAISAGAIAIAVLAGCGNLTAGSASPETTATTTSSSSSSSSSSSIAPPPGERVSTSEMAELKAAMLIATTAAAAVTAHIKSDEFNTGQLAALSIMGSSGADIADDMSSRL